MTEDNEMVRLRWIEKNGVRYLSIADLDSWLESHIADFEDDPESGDAETLQDLRDGLLRFIEQIEEQQDKV